ncbi:polysaccharide biosynthesis/export family protein [Hymenobacter sp. GOD-10R]|uniref:polysaccharide biosynthesis/export family protein n=1 Tax=Hymenobacter sp. GOD-10R TaxID=3093922 RepID=UPI002D786D44|nr:polysaccharide biosynthesis/export family protein [Hymenobacter sp. GOD-10R]WRQ30344.1 polysaccharide biosynthesis/export family protein [Hymenobacter sp. GOD-10R]
MLHLFLKQKKLLVLWLFTTAYASTSCSSYKNIPYFKDLSKTSISDDNIQNYTPITIQPEDILGVNVSSLNQEAAAVFNYNLNRVNGNNYDVAPANPVVGYRVDAIGNIQLPLIGEFKVAGFTTSEIQQKLRQRLVTYLKEPVVNIRLLNFKVSIIGDVLKPDTYTIQNERITILEALTLAGDLNITALRTNVLLVREQNNKREYIPIDLTSKKLFASPYYYLKNNDVIYVQPDKTKFATVDRGYRTATLVLSGLSIIAIVLSNLYR